MAADPRPTLGARRLCTPRVGAGRVGHDRDVSGQRGRRELGRRLGVELGLLRPSHAPRSQLARVSSVGADSSNGELIAATVISSLEFLVVASNVFSDSLWFRLTSPVVALVLLVNPVRAVRLLLQQRRAGRGQPAAR